MAAVYSTQGANVVYNVRDFTTSTNLRRAQITPLSTPAVVGTNIIQSDRLTFTNITDGNFTVTNMVGPVTYRVELIGPFTTTTFTNLIPDTNITINAKDYISSTIAAGATVGYSQSVADLRFVLVTNGGAVNLTVTNAATVLGNVNISTNATINSNLNIGGFTVHTNAVTNLSLTASRFILTDANKKHVSTGASADLSATLTDETGGGSAVFSASPTFTGTVNANNISANGVTANTLTLPSGVLGFYKTTHKTADETVVDTVLQNDDHLTFNVGNGEKWAFEIVAFVTGGGDGIKVTIDWDSVATPTTLIWDTTITVANTFILHQVNSTRGTVDSLASVDADTVVRIEGFIDASDDATVSFKWAKNTDTTTDTTVRNGSFIRITKL